MIHAHIQNTMKLSLVTILALSATTAYTAAVNQALINNEHRQLNVPGVVTTLLGGGGSGTSTARSSSSTTASSSSSIIALATSSVVTSTPSISTILPSISATVSTVLAAPTPLNVPALLSVLSAIETSIANIAASPDQLDDSDLIDQFIAIELVASENATALLTNVDVSGITLATDLEVCAAIRRIITAEQRVAGRIENDCSNGHGPIGDSAELASLLEELTDLRVSINSVMDALISLGVIPQCAANTRAEEDNIREVFAGLLLVLHGLDNSFNTTSADALVAEGLGIDSGVQGAELAELAGRPSRSRKRLSGCDQGSEE